MGSRCSTCRSSHSALLSFWQLGQWRFPQECGHEVLLPAMGTLVLMATQRRCVTGGDGTKDFPVMDRQTMRLGEIRQRDAHDFAQGDGLRRTGLRATGHRIYVDGRLSALPSPAKIDQVERTADLVQPLLANMEVGRSRRKPTVAQQPLECERVHAGF